MLSRCSTIPVMLVLGVACADSGEPMESGDAHGGGPVLAPSDEVPYELAYDTSAVTLDAIGGGSPNRREGPDCASSFRLQFFTGAAEVGAEPDSFVEVYFPSYSPGARSLVPSLDDRIDFWTPPQWRIDGEIRAIFGGVAELVAYDVDRVSVRFTDTEMCTIPVWGHLEAGSYDFYADIATDCVALAEVTLDAVADPVGSFTSTAESEDVIGDVAWPTTWATEASEPLCY